MVRAHSRNHAAAGGPLTDYLREIRGVPLLSAAEEVELALAIRDGDDGAKNRLILANLRLVIRVARDFEGRGLSLDDLVGEGNLGLIRAAEEYDPSFGTRFSTYASYWIKQSIRHALITTTATIRLPAHMVNLLTKWRRAERSYLREFGHPPTFEQIAVMLGLTDAKRDMVERALQACRLLPGGSLGDEPDALLEAAAEDIDPETRLEAQDESRELQRRMRRLDSRERTVLTLRYGLENQEPMTLKEVGSILGVTREWVRKIEVRAVSKLGDDEEAARPPRRVAPRAQKLRRRSA